MTRTRISPNFKSGSDRISPRACPARNALVVGPRVRPILTGEKGFFNLWQRASRRSMSPQTWKGIWHRHGEFHHRLRDMDQESCWISWTTGTLRRFHDLQRRPPRQFTAGNQAHRRSGRTGPVRHRRFYLDEDTRPDFGVSLTWVSRWCWPRIMKNTTRKWAAYAQADYKRRTNGPRLWASGTRKTRTCLHRQSAETFCTPFAPPVCTYVDSNGDNISDDDLENVTLTFSVYRASRARSSGAALCTSIHVGRD